MSSVKPFSAKKNCVFQIDIEGAPGWILAREHVDGSLEVHSFEKGGKVWRPHNPSGDQMEIIKSKFAEQD